MAMTDRPVLFFWGSAALFAAVFAVLAPHLLPYDALGILTQADRERAWLLTVFCGGVFAVLFGSSTLIGRGSAVGLRDVVEAGSARVALERAAEARRAKGVEPYTRNFGAWTVVSGVFLIAIYFGLWQALG